jgi:CBS domain-containing protein
VKLKNICSKDVATVEPKASLRTAAGLMRERHVGALLVVEGSRPVGIVTDRDIVVAVVAVPGARPEGIRVCDVMPAQLVTIRDSDGVFEALQKMAHEGVRRLPVVDGHGDLVGIVTSDDILRALATELASFAAALQRGGEHERAARRPIPTP